MHYTGTIWRPPYEAYSLLVQVTAGCTHHSCKFCTLYEDLPFKFKLYQFSEVKADLAEASKYYRKIPRIFFTGANPFVLNTEKLKTLAKMVKEYYPFYKTIGCFARITDIMPKSLEDLKELRALGYDGITIGVETGDDESLTFMNKGFQSKDVLEQCRKLDEAGISYNRLPGGIEYHEREYEGTRFAFYLNYNESAVTVNGVNGHDLISNEEINGDMVIERLGVKIVKCTPA